jgi:tRNA pseudouridine55 synthase
LSTGGATRTPSGLLVVWKPKGMTSHDVVAAVRRLTGIRQVGHGGTLDPGAEGILPIAVGSCTRLMSWLRVDPKRYHGTAVVGVLTATGDAEGAAVGWSGPPWPRQADWQAAARWLEGRRLQIPPRVSAIKQKGVPQYVLVRRGQAVVPPVRKVQIDQLKVVEVLGPHRFRFEATVGTGTYVRALVRDWGFLLGQAAHVEHLARVGVGPWGPEDAVELEALMDLGARWREALRKPGPALAIPVVEVAARRVWEIRHGHIGPWAELWGRRGVVALGFRGEVLAVAEGPPWRYRAVLWAAEASGS